MDFPSYLKIENYLNLNIFMHHIIKELQSQEETELL